MTIRRRRISTIGTRALTAAGISLSAIVLVGCGLLENMPQQTMPVALAQSTPQTAAEVTPLATASPQARMGLTLVPLTLPAVTPVPTALPTMLPIAENTALSLLILHTNDTRGYVAPCG
jgi:hypothetical protein